MEWTKYYICPLCAKTDSRVFDQLRSCFRCNERNRHSLTRQNHWLG